MSTPHQDLWSPEEEERRRRRVKQEAWMSWCVCKSSNCLPYMYSIVPQKVWVTVPSWMDSLHRPKSVSFTCPRRWMRTEDTLEGSKLCFKSWMQNKQKISARKSQLVKDMYLGRTFSKQLLVFQYRCYWAWCSQVLSPCRWCLFGAGDPAPLRSRPGRNCQQKKKNNAGPIFRQMHWHFYPFFLITLLYLHTFIFCPHYDVMFTLLCLSALSVSFIILGILLTLICSALWFVYRLCL